MMRNLRVPGLLVLAAGLTVVGWLLMGTNFMIHDDEGYVLIGLKYFSEHGGLYDGIFTQYGPVPFLYYDALHRLLDWPVTNLFGRILTLAHWIVAAFATGLIAWRLSGRYWTALFALAAAFCHIWQMTWEPPHPGGLIALFTAVGLAGSVEAVWRNRTGLAFFLLGLTGAALLLTKINVGLFWICAAGAFLLANTGGPFLRGRGAGLAAVGLLLLPFALMRPLLGEYWVLTLAVMSALTGGVVCALLAAETTPSLRGRDWLAGAAGFAGLGVVIVITTLARGTSPGGLLQGVLLDPLRHPVNFNFGFVWQPLAWIALAGTVTVAVLWRMRPGLRPALVDGVAGLRLLVLVGFAWKAKVLLTVYGAGHFVSHALPLAPLFVLPLTAAPGGDRRRLATWLVVLVAMGQVLHTYPVSGTQTAWGSFLLLAVFSSGLADAATHLASRLNRPWLQAAVITVALGAAGWQAKLLTAQAWSRWTASDPLGLPGAEALRPPENIRYALRILTANAGLHADLLFSRPGMFSFNLWTGLPTPTRRNATHWFWLLSAADQQAILNRLQAEPRSVVISSRPLIDFLDQKIHLTVSGPLNDFIQQHYRTLFTVTGYDFLVPRDSPAAPFFVARNFQRAAGAAGTEPAMIMLNVAAQAKVARIILRDVRDPTRILAQWQADNSRVTLQAINSAGRAAGDAQACPWPLQLAGLHRLQLYHHLAISRDHADLQLVFLDPDGQPLLEACYQEPVSDAAPPAGG